MHDSEARPDPQLRSGPERRMDDGTAAGWSGLIAGAVYLLAQMTLATLVRHDSPWASLQRISALLLGPDALPPPGRISLTIAGFALMIHFSLAFCYGRLVGQLLRRIPPALGWLGGAACGLAIYVVNFHVIGPFLFPWFADSQGPVTWLDHVLFGVVVAMSFLALRAGRGDTARLAGRLS